jgi:hypothetical protein
MTLPEGRTGRWCQALKPDPDGDSCLPLARRDVVVTRVTRH